ncbi:MAG: hypothetical protein K0U68_16235 [Gammaproteobacteria bacterium]|nr:hypothetical protein [Gammaproteobacteria bacterium]
MRTILILASAFLLTACFSEDMKSSQNNTQPAETTISSFEASSTHFG